jgi:hypothetical protein
MLLTLICLQTIQVAILWFHDWLPIGNLTDIPAVQAHDTRSRLIRVTLVQSVPFTIGLFASVAYARTSHPTWLNSWLWISYGMLFAGELRAWWPYLVRPKHGPCHSARIDRRDINPARAAIPHLASFTASWRSEACGQIEFPNPNFDPNRLF